MKPKVMLVDDYAIIRNGLENLITDLTDMEVVGHAENGQVAVEQAEELKPDVIVMDVSMPKMDGIEATRLIKEQNPGIKIIGLSAYRDSAHVTSMIEAGASGFVCKNDLFEKLVGAIKEVL